MPENTLKKAAEPATEAREVATEATSPATTSPAIAVITEATSPAAVATLPATEATPQTLVAVHGNGDYKELIKKFLIEQVISIVLDGNTLNKGNVSDFKNTILQSLVYK